MLGPSDRAESGSGCPRKPVAAGSCRRACQGFDEFTLAAGFGAAPPRQLHAMGGIEDHRIAEAAHDGETSACRRPDCCSRRGRSRSVRTIRWLPASSTFLTALPISGGDRNCLLDVHDLAGLRGGNQQVGLPTEKAESAACPRHARPRRLILCVDVGQNRDADLLLTLARTASPF